MVNIPGKSLLLTFLCTCFIASASLQAQPLHGARSFSHQDTLRGTLSPQRTWWDVTKYEITVQPDFDSKTIRGKNIISYSITRQKHSDTAQIDLQEPMVIDSVFAGSTRTAYTRDGNAFFVYIPPQGNTTTGAITIYYHGHPREAVRPPWDGGWIWKLDDRDRPWMSVACQGLGASVWYPCKDHQSDEPNQGAVLNIIVPDSLVAVGNGRLKEKKKNDNGTTTWTWVVVNPINNYDIIPYIGKYVNFQETFMGEKGKLLCSYWVLDYNLDKAKEQFKQVPLMLKCFEYWMGPYPFYEDSYKLVEAPHLGMEHQSATAYGNKYHNGYLGRDLSGTGWGLKWDFIIVHESGHEWFGNNITSKDVADMWVHEGFTNYSEALFTECQYGKKAGQDYVIGTRKNIKNDIPIIGIYGVNQEGSGDMYYKSGNMLNTIRQVINDDEKFRQILRGLNKTFYHATVTTQEIEGYISIESGIDFSKVFDQYLRTTQIPVLEYKIVNDKTVAFRWTNCVKGFNLPLKIVDGEEQWIKPTEEWQTIHTGKPAGFTVDRNFYVNVKKVMD
ncbi:MAG TPA: M1 family metallopeptidase [Chitinophagaceae bacterium]|jgi:aminopeptidase N